MRFANYYKKQNLFPNREKAFFEDGSSDVAIYGASGTGCHRAIEKHIAELLQYGTNHVYIYADKSAIRTFYEEFAVNGRVHLCDISSIGIKTPELQEEPGFAKGDMAHIFIDLYNIPITEKTFSNLKTFMENRKGKELNEIRTYICNRYNNATSCFAEKADAVVLFYLDEDSLYNFSCRYSPVKFLKKMYWLFFLEFAMRKKGRLSKGKTRVFFRINNKKAPFFATKKIRLFENGR